MESYRVNIIGLSNKIHHFDYEVGDAFFGQYGKDLLSEGVFKVAVSIDKHETFLEVKFHIKGTAKLICDRSLDPFDYPVDTHKLVIFKYGEEDKEISDEMMVIHRDTVSLELGQYIYEFIGLTLPMKRLHPRFQDEKTESEETFVYSSSTDDADKKEEEIDPRWEKLKKLK